LHARKNYPDPTVIKKYLPKLSDGVRQLDATAKVVGDHDHTLKILVHYEPFFISDGILRPLAVRNCYKELSSKERIFFSDLEDIEHLFQIMCDLPAVAQAVLLEKLHLETQNNGVAQGKEFNQIIQRHTELGWNRFVNDHINHYSNYIFPDSLR
jgi:hypothetical protein